MLNINKAGILALLIALSVLVGPVSAAQYVYQGDNNTVIQEKINNATVGEDVIFESGPLDYTGISLTVNKALNLQGNGATLVGSGNSIFTITGTNGVTIRDFIININSTTGGDGITGSNVYNCNIINNTITNGEDGVNIFMHYGGLTIANNTINNMYNGRDGISLVNHNTTIDMDTYTPTLIEGNTIDDVQYGIFLGGNFKGTITGNSISATVAGMNITGKRAADNGILYADITNNILTNVGIGIAMENHNVYYLNLDSNIIHTIISGAYSILTNSDYRKIGYITVTNNDFDLTETTPNLVSPNFMDPITGADVWSNNT